MGIRSKFFFVMGPLLFAMAFFVYNVISERVLQQFSEIEAELAEQNVDRALNALSASLDTVNTQLSDWAKWDDAYVFIQDHNEDFIKSNLDGDATLEGMKLSAMIFLDNNNAIVKTKNIYDNDIHADAIPESILAKLTSDYFTKHAAADESHTGILHIDDTIFLVASRPIVQTNGSGPIGGTIIFVKVVDNALVNEISQRVHLPLQIYTSADTLPVATNLIEKLREDGKEGMDDVVVVEGNNIAAYGSLHDIFEKHTLFARIEMPRDIYHYGESAVHFFSIFFGVSFAIFSLISMALLEWFVFAPLSKLNVNVDRIRHSNDDAIRIEVGGNDEFTHLGNNINQMIEGLHAMRQQKEESENRFQTVADLAPVMIWMSGLDKKCTYFNKGWFDFTGRSFKEEEGEGWLDGVHPDDLERCKTTYATAFDARQSFRMEYRLRNAAGKYRWVLDSGIPNFDAGEVFLGYLGTCIDITDRKKSEKEQAQKMSEVETMNQLMVSRELKMVELKEELARLRNKDREDEHA